MTERKNLEEKMENRTKIKKRLSKLVKNLPFENVFNLVRQKIVVTMCLDGSEIALTCILSLGS